MKKYIEKLFFLPALIAALSLIPAGSVTAQTFTALHSFTATVYTSSNRDGAYPFAGLITNSSGNTLYGTAAYGGGSGNGTVFAVNTNGTGFRILHSFTPITPSCCYTDDVSGDVSCYCSFNSDGASPLAGLILSGNSLYGTAFYGGSSGIGTVFALNTNGTGFRILHSFTGGSDGASPYAVLILSGNSLYGTASYGGSSGNGTVFAVHTDGRGFTTLHSFTATLGNDGFYGTNS